MAHDYCPYELVFDTIKSIEPIYNIDDYARESKYRLEIEHK